MNIDAKNRAFYLSRYLIRNMKRYKNMEIHGHTLILGHTLIHGVH